MSEPLMQAVTGGAGIGSVADAAGTAEATHGSVTPATIRVETVAAEQTKKPTAAASPQKRASAVGTTRAAAPREPVSGVVPSAMPTDTQDEPPQLASPERLQDVAGAGRVVHDPALVVSAAGVFGSQRPDVWRVRSGSTQLPIVALAFTMVDAILLVQPHLEAAEFRSLSVWSDGAL
jgi:hypothetical protein